MEISEALEILALLYDGFDPDSKTPLANESVLQRPRIVRALGTVVHALDIPKTFVAQPRPEKSGKPWTEQEDAMLCQEFHHHVDFWEIGRRHRRTKGAIVSRLIKLGEIKATVSPTEAA